MESHQETTERCQQIRLAMHEHVAHRLAHALGKLEGKTDPATQKRRAELVEKYQLAGIVEKGVRVAKDIAVASHIAKGVHPDLRVKTTTNLAVNFSELPQLNVLGSHILSDDDKLHDTTGDGAKNAAAYELYLLLESRFEGQKLIDLLQLEDPDATAAVNASTQLDDAAALCMRLQEPKCAAVSTSTLSKQLYWLAGTDACDDAHYTLLAPLYATSLAHAVHAQVQEDRFGGTNKAARQARRERKMHDGVFHDYPGLAVQNMGGTKPQNISQLNSERRGMNYLLSSLPPKWQTSAVRLPVHAASVFDRLFIARPEVHNTVRTLRMFLESDPDANLATRKRREELLDALVDEMVSLAAELQQILPPGWSRDDERFADLHRSEQLWLDPLRAEQPDEADFAREWLQLDWPAAVGQRFANWLNAQLRGKLPVGDAEARAWQKELLTDEDGFKQQLRELRNKLDAPHYIPIRKTHAELVALREENS
ncbi:MAG: type I-F CRISPR-associated protein Csy1 [Desulfuromonadaceae bacterium]|nr:type I-F CRISPR-associated protein Csy1 [Desulfuromonadaceae bacterium]